MSPEERELLKKSLALAEENNEILRSMRRSQRWGNVTRAIYWVFIIGSAVGAYYFIQPYIDQAKSIYGGTSDLLKNFNQQ